MGGEDRLGMGGSKAPPGRRRTRLDEDGPALGWPGDVQGAAHLVPAPDVVDAPDARRLGVAARAAIVANGIVGPAVPELGDDLYEFGRALVALGMRDLVVIAEVRPCARDPGGDDVPADPTVADVIERGELAREIVRLGIGRRGGGDEAEPLRDAGEGRKRRQRLKPAARVVL